MNLQTFRRSMLPAIAAGVMICGADATTLRFEKHFPVKGHPVVCIHNVGSGRIEVKSAKVSEVIVATTQSSNKVNLEYESAGDRIDVSANIADATAQPGDLEVNFQLTVPEETELELRTQTGLIYVEQVMGDMTLQSVAGDVHLKEVSGYIVVRTTNGGLICTQCAGKLDFNLNLFTTTGNILFDGDFIRTGIYTMRSGKGTVEVHFSGTDSFDLDAQTNTGTVDNQAEAYLKQDSHGMKHIASRFTKGLFGTVGTGLAKVELSSYSGTIRILKRD
jgi:DUF4097 and DUF4098 domain-containing protein YvlB